MRLYTTILGVITVAALSSPQPTASVENLSKHTLRLAEGAPRPTASISDVAWLVGHWEGEGLGGVSAETWSPAQRDRMYGTYTLTKQDGLVFSEAMLLVEEEGSLVLKIKHFDPDFLGWEEKADFVSFPLVRTGDHEALFRGLTFRRTGDTLHVYLVLTEGGKRTEHEFRFERRPL